MKYTAGKGRKGHPNSAKVRKEGGVCQGKVSMCVIWLLLFLFFVFIHSIPFRCKSCLKEFFMFFCFYKNSFSHLPGGANLANWYIIFFFTKNHNFNPQSNVLRSLNYCLSTFLHKCVDSTCLRISSLFMFIWKNNKEGI